MVSIAYGVKLDMKMLPKCFACRASSGTETEFSLPLSDPDAGKLKSLATSEGAPAWQLDASNIWFPENDEFLDSTVQKLVEHTSAQLRSSHTINPESIRARFRKLVLYGAGMSFQDDGSKRDHADLLGTVIIHLPMQSSCTGGKLRIRMDSSRKSLKPEGFYLAAFAADSHFELREVAEGMRLCLVFAMEKVGPAPHIEHWISEETLVPCMKELQSSIGKWLAGLSEHGVDDAFPCKLVLLLQGKYSRGLFSFSELHSPDRLLVDALVVMAGKEKRFDLYLCGLRKMMWDSQVSLELQRDGWIALLEGAEAELKPLEHVMSVELRSEVWMLGKDQVFDDTLKPIKLENKKRYYETLVLMLAPKSMSVYFSCHSGLSKALDLVSSEDDLKQVFCFLRKNSDALSSPVPCQAKLLRLCMRLGYHSFFIDAVGALGKISSGDVIDVLLEVVHIHGWSSSLEAAISSLEVRDRQLFSYFALKLEEFGFTDAAAGVIRMLNLEEPSLQVFLTSLLDALEKDSALVEEQLNTSVIDQATLKLLIESRSESLRRSIETSSESYWCQTRARFPDYIEVERFLRSPLQEFIFRGGSAHRFAGRTAVERFVDRYFQTRDFDEYGYNSKLKFSAYATVGSGVRTHASCTITKTSKACDLLKPQSQIDLLNKLKLLLLRRENRAFKKSRLW